MKHFKKEKYTYRLKTLSKLVLSPRDQHGYYLDAEDFKKEDIALNHDDQKKVKIIYPFYQYGDYSYYCPESTQYYIPGSSLKGTILSNFSDQLTFKLMVDDIRIESKDLQLTHLSKLQNLSNETGRKIKLDVFFPNIAVEMLKAESEYSGELFSDEKIEKYLHEAQCGTKTKLEQLKNRLNLIDYSRLDEVTEIHVSTFRRNIESVLHVINEKSNDSFILVLGGYKGLALSGIFNETDFDSAIYIDQSVYLPHGLVEISKIEQVNK